MTTSLKLYITAASPYSRMARIMVIEKRLQSRVELITAQTRVVDSPYYAINPSGRVPYLVMPDGSGLEESALICHALDGLDGRPALDVPGPQSGLRALQLEAMARSMLDGLAVWFRETVRPAHERSPGVIRHEQARAARLADAWEHAVSERWMRGRFNLAQLTLGCALGFEPRLPDWRWREGRPALTEWFDRISTMRAFADTVPEPFVPKD